MRGCLGIIGKCFKVRLKGFVCWELYKLLVTPIGFLGVVTTRGQKNLSFRPRIFRSHTYGRLSNTIKSKLLEFYSSTVVKKLEDYMLIYRVLAFLI